MRYCDSKVSCLVPENIHTTSRKVRNSEGEGGQKSQFFSRKVWSWTGISRGVGGKFKPKKNLLEPCQHSNPAWPHVTVLQPTYSCVYTIVTWLCMYVPLTIFQTLLPDCFCQTILTLGILTEKWIKSLGWPLVETLHQVFRCLWHGTLFVFVPRDFFHPDRQYSMTKQLSLGYFSLPQVGC